MILSASATLGIVAAVAKTYLPAALCVLEPLYEGVYPMLGALGTALVGFNTLALLMSRFLTRGERWAWCLYAVVLPLGWVSQFVFLPDLAYLVLAILTTVGLMLPYRSSSSCGERSTGLKSNSTLSPRGGKGEGCLPTSHLPG